MEKNLEKLRNAYHLTLEEKGMMLTILSDKFQEKPLVKDLPEMTYLSRPTVLRILNQLRAKGIIKNERLYGEGGNKGFTWEINL
jgi:predicted transcriptional regulator